MEPGGAGDDGQAVICGEEDSGSQGGEACWLYGDACHTRRFGKADASCAPFADQASQAQLRECDASGGGPPFMPPRFWASIFCLCSSFAFSLIFCFSARHCSLSINLETVFKYDVLLNLKSFDIDYGTMLIKV